MASESGTGVVSAQSDVDDVVLEIVTVLAPERPREAQRDDDLVADLGYHSLARVELIFALEDLFCIEEIPPETAAAISGVADLCRYIAAEVQAGRGRMPSPEDVLEITSENCGSTDSGGW